MNDSSGKVLRRNIKFIRKKKTLSLELVDEKNMADKEQTVINNESNNNMVVRRSKRKIKIPERFGY